MTLSDIAAGYIPPGVGGGGLRLRRRIASLRKAVPIHRGPNGLSHPACMFDICFEPSGSSGGLGVLLPG